MGRSAGLRPVRPAHRTPPLPALRRTRPLPALRGSHRSARCAEAADNPRTARNAPGPRTARNAPGPRTARNAPGLRTARNLTAPRAARDTPRAASVRRYRFRKRPAVAQSRYRCRLGHLGYGWRGDVVAELRLARRVGAFIYGWRGLRFGPHRSPHCPKLAARLASMTPHLLRPSLLLQNASSRSPEPLSVPLEGPRLRLAEGCRC
jgi:hypothetical protein